MKKFKFKDLIIKITKTFFKINKTKKRIVVSRGGSSSGKTYSTLQIILIWLLTGNLGEDIIKEGVCSIVRKYKSNLTKGALRDFKNIISKIEKDSGIKFSHLINYNKTEKTFSFIDCDGYERIVEFMGADDEQKVRGPRREILYCNEANELSYNEEFMQLMMRTKYKIFIDFNPSSDQVWIKKELEEKRFFDKKDIDIVVTTYKDNDFLDKSIIEEIENLKNIDEELWKVYGLGQYGIIEGVIFDKINFANSVKGKLIGYGLDFGFSNDPSGLVEVFKYENKETGEIEIYLNELLYKTGLTNDDLVGVFKNFNIGKLETIIGDSAEQKSIEEIYRKGYNIRGVKKGKDSIKYGIGLMKTYKIFITTSSINLKKEFENYLWKKDKNGNSLNEPIDKFNHLIDAVRYVFMELLNDKGSGNKDPGKVWFY